MNGPAIPPCLAGKGREPAQAYFPIEAGALAHLKKREPILGAVPDRIPQPKRPIKPDLFAALVDAILSQQISAKAADTVWGRFKARFSPITPAHVASLCAEEIQACGTTFRKAGNIRAIAEQINSGAFSLEALPDMPDEAVCKALASLPGIGRWTAEMLLIHCLCRPDVISYGDLAILRGMRMLYQVKKVTPALFCHYRKLYAPYATTASIYLWAIAAGALPGLDDPGRK